MAISGMTEDYNQFMSELQSAIEAALYTTVRKGLTDELYKSAMRNVYSYDAAPYFMAKRRYTIVDPDTMTADVSLSGTILRLTNHSALQIGEPGETEIVEEGMAAWHQPYPRPFMEDGLEKYVSSGRAERDLEQTLIERGFKVV